MKIADIKYRRSITYTDTPPPRPHYLHSKLNSWYYMMQCRKIVKQIDIMGIDVVFVVGGNGGNAGAAAVQEELDRSNVLCSVIGVPKSIDNDILLIDKCFGFDTAVEEAQRALISAKVEASSAFHGVGVVKVMGRQSGFIAMNASLASGVVDICLIPEVPFALHGENGMFAFLDKVLSEKGHAVICVAEGAGQDLLAKGEQQTDASGNPILQDVGLWLKSKIKKQFKDVDIKYIDPSMLIMNDIFLFRAAVVLNARNTRPFFFH